MKPLVFNRIIGVLLSALVLCASVPAQDALGGNKLLAPPAPNLGTTASLRRVFRAGRPMLGYVRRVGGVAFDAVASPIDGLRIEDMTLSYSSSPNDGQRLLLSVNGQAVSTGIYDWQLIPVAKFANSGDSSCVTLFGRLDSSFQELLYLRQGARIVNYHPSFQDTLLGLRLLQLDNLIIDDSSIELPTQAGRYLLGAGESAPGEENRAALTKFKDYRDENEVLFNRYNSYVISDHRRNISFDTQSGNLNISGEPSYYVWDVDDEEYREFASQESLRAAKSRVQAELRRVGSAKAVRPKRVWLINQIQESINRYAREVDDHLIVESLGYSELQKLLEQDALTRIGSLNQQSLTSLVDRLVELRILEKMPVVTEVAELSQGLSNNTQMLRGINPAVWDAGVAVLRYSAFFRYVKNNHPQQWQSFMAQIEGAPAPQPPATTPTVMIPAPGL